MFSAFEWMMAMRYLRPRREQGFVSIIASFSLLGIALGVATLIIVMSVMNGFRQELMDRILGFNGHVNVYGPGEILESYDALADRLRRVAGVVSVFPVVEGQVMVSGPQAARGAVVRGVRPGSMGDRTLIKEHILAGSLDTFSGNAVFLGSRLASALGVTVGDNVTLISPKGNVTAFGTVPRMRAYKVAGLFQIGMYQYDSGYLYMPLEAAQVYFKTGSGVTKLEVFANNPDRARAVGTAVGQAAGTHVRIQDWQVTNRTFFNALQVERNVMFLILTLIIMVAAFNIVSSLIMMVKGKGRDIAILRTIGATRGMIMRVFFLAGATVGVAGTLTGLGLGLAFALNIETIRRAIESLAGVDLFNAEIYFLAHMPAQVDYTEVGLVVGMGLGLSFLATLYPSWQAARLDPVEALRYE